MTWNGSSLSLDAISPADGFVAEIKDGGGDRVRVEFERGDGHSPRIEVRVNDGQLEVEID